MADYELLRRLCTLDGISGQEDEVRNFILEEIKPYCSSVQVTALGCIIAEKKGKNPAVRKLMLDAHMDEVGLTVSYISDDGLLHFETTGGIDEKVLAGISVKVGYDKLPGVIGVKPAAACKGAEADKPYPKDSMTIDIGAKNREEAEQYVSLGDPVVFNSPYFEQEDRVFGKCFDDRAGCAILIEMIRSELDYDMTFVFSVQEELGLRGARTASYIVAPDAAIVLDSTTAGDRAGVEGGRCVARFGQGPVISFMDKGTSYDKGLYNLGMDCAKQLGVPAQTKTMVAGGNDSGAVHVSRGGVRTVSASMPCRYLHAPVCMIVKSDYEAMLGTVKLLAQRIAGGEG